MFKNQEKALNINVMLIYFFTYHFILYYTYYFIDDRKSNNFNI